MGREQGIRRLTAINLMKRMESSVYSFNLTLTRIKALIDKTIKAIDDFNKFTDTKLDLTDISDVDEFDDEDQNVDDLFLLVKNKNQSCRYGLCFMEKKSAKRCRYS